jgi:NAD(P)-dependent dehydrogenase (short-subunit alcohol dehydrogenase family)
VGGNHSLTERVLDDFGRLDVLANNLGNFSATSPWRDR